MARPSRKIQQPLLFPIGDLAGSRKDTVEGLSAEESAQTWHETRALFVKLAVDAYLKACLEEGPPGASTGSI